MIMLVSRTLVVDFSIEVSMRLGLLVVYGRPQGS